MSLLDAMHEAILAGIHPKPPREVAQTSLIYRIFGGTCRSQVGEACALEYSRAAPPSSVLHPPPSQQLWYLEAPTGSYACHGTGCARLPHSLKGGLHAPLNSWHTDVGSDPSAVLFAEPAGHLTPSSHHSATVSLPFHLLVMCKSVAQSETLSLHAGEVLRVRV